MPGFIWSSRSGCLLPFLIIFNLFFGRLIFGSTRIWLGIELVLILMFVFKINTMARKISQELRQGSRDEASNSPIRNKGKIIDVQGQVIEEKEKLK